MKIYLHQIQDSVNRWVSIFNYKRTLELVNKQNMSSLKTQHFFFYLIWLPPHPNKILCSMNLFIQFNAKFSFPHPVVSFSIPYPAQSPQPIISPTFKLFCSFFSFSSQRKSSNPEKTLISGHWAAQWGKGIGSGLEKTWEYLTFTPQTDPWTRDIL